jgi:hypothetical protein
VQLKISCKQQLLKIDFLLAYRKLLDKVKKTNTFSIVRIANGEHHPIVGEGNVNLTLANREITTILKILYVFKKKKVFLIICLANKGYYLCSIQINASLSTKKIPKSLATTTKTSINNYAKCVNSM